MTSIVVNNKGLIKPFLKYGMLTAVVAAGFSFGILTANASNSTACYDVVGQGMDVDYNGTGVFNSGKPIFDYITPPGNAPNYSYQGCLEDMSDEGWPNAVPSPNAAAFGNPPALYYQVKGWAWDDNLGWISMYCEDEDGNIATPYTNTGIACGGFKYGVTIDENGDFYGYAWGDNVGWISFNNGAFSRVKIEIDPPECQGYVYGPVPPDPVCAAHSKTDTMAWSDNVGWIDFDGVLFPWFQVTEEIIEPNVTVELIPDPNTKLKTAAVLTDKPPVANGVDGYTVRVTILDQDGLPLEEPRYQTDINLIWGPGGSNRDTVKKNQTTNVAANLLGSIPACTPHANRAVTKPCLFTTGDNYLGLGVWEGLITSVAPTSNMNKKLKPADPPTFPPSETIVYDYEKFIVPVGKTVAETNDLTLSSVDIDVLDTANGLWVYGDVVNGTPVNRGFNIPEIRNVVMKFLPQTEVVTLNEDDNIDYIDVNVNEPQSFSIQGTAGAGDVVTLYGGLEPLVTGLNMVFDSDANGEVLFGEPVQIDATGWLNGPLFNFIAGVAQQAGAQVSQYLKGIYIYSIVSDPVNGVFYYSNKLPRVVGSTGVQPVAILRGSVYSVGAVTTTTTQGDPIRSLGEISTNLLRDQVFRNVSGLIAGASQPSKDPVMLVEGDSSRLGGFQSGTGIIKPLLEDNNDVPKVYYSGGDIYVGRLGDINPLTWTGERTIVTTGGNIYIDQDLYNAAISPRPKLGLIALKDFSASAEVQAMQGHVYIHNTVTNVQANIFADGSVFSYYDKAQGFQPDGRPVFADVNDYEDKTRYHQLFIEGSVASQNTIGGSTRMPRIDGMGIEVGSDVLRARQYDLNFLRMYTGLINRAPDGTALDAITGLPLASESDLRVVTATGLPWSKYLDVGGEFGDLWPPNDLAPGSYYPADGLDALTDLGSTYIFYDPPSPMLPGFQGGTEFDISLTAG